jgi:hypothetical protein
MPHSTKEDACLICGESTLPHRIATTFRELRIEFCETCYGIYDEENRQSALADFLGTSPGLQERHQQYRKKSR